MNRYVLCVIAMLMITSFAFRHGHSHRHQARVQAKAKNHYAAMARARFTQGPGGPEGPEGPRPARAPEDWELEDDADITEEREAEITFWFIDYDYDGIIVFDDVVEFITYDWETDTYYELTEQEETEIQAEFDEADTNGDEDLTLREFIRAYLDLPADEVEVIA